mgnify:CR=1 FL=1
MRWLAIGRDGGSAAMMPGFREAAKRRSIESPAGCACGQLACSRAPRYWSRPGAAAVVSTLMAALPTLPAAVSSSVAARTASTLI